MQTREIVSEYIKPLRAIDTAREALAAMRESKQNLLPVVDQTTNRFIGMVTRAAAEKHDITVDSVLTIREKTSIVTDPDQNIFDTVRLMDKHNLSLLPVLDNNKNYIGVIERNVLNDRIIRLMNLTEYGSLIIIHFEEQHYTLSRIVRIVEAEGGLILGMSVEAPQGNNPFYEVTVKLNMPDPGPVMSALKRHDYIVHAHSIDNQEDRRYEERADELMHYLNM